MPFTPSHMAAALPLLRTPLLPAALVVGTMAPDIPYYLPLFVSRELTHSLLGWVTIDLALGVVGALAWWFVLREALVDLLPRAIGTRIPRVERTAWRPAGWGWPLTVAVLLLSVLIGAATHLLWDSFTHPGWLVDRVPLLRAPLGPLLVEKWLQHLSTIAGLVILAVWAVKRYRAATPDVDRPTRFTAHARLAAGAGIAVAGVVGGTVPWVHGILSGVAPFDPGLVFLVARLGIAVGGAALAIVVVLWLSVGRAPRPRPAS